MKRYTNLEQSSRFGYLDYWGWSRINQISSRALDLVEIACFRFDDVFYRRLKNKAIIAITNTIDMTTEERASFTLSCFFILNFDSVGDAKNDHF